ncbi:MAG: 1-acyl-sn-glycerol-3-phosphate acyltransferase [Spirochaetes bacterium]|nr:1-acyl-sn-glycerol-3-phosphate acyltransferase [Spirochaetota bacterium]MBU1081542.1 1-acyl-sn-glycerol-3-phosphate acyltransferase [Spirochaetota bacterium]
MGTFIFAIATLALAVLYEAPAYLCRFLPPGERRGQVADIALRAMERFIRCAKCYSGLGLLYERPDFELPERCIVVSNHQSLFDIPILMHYFKDDRRLLFVAKKELGYGIPLISSVLKIGGHALIDRGGRSAQSMKALGSFARRCSRAGFWPSIFPEGTRSKDGILGKFHSAGLRRIMETIPGPLLVVAVDGGWKAAGLGMFLAKRPSIEYRVKAIALIEAGPDKTSVADALDASRAVIGRQLEAWHAEAPL